MTYQPMIDAGWKPDYHEAGRVIWKRGPLAAEQVRGNWEIWGQDGWAVWRDDHLPEWALLPEAVCPL